MIRQPIIFLFVRQAMQSRRIVSCMVRPSVGQSDGQYFGRLAVQSAIPRQEPAT
ncbi:hypothetical protein NXW78_28155 [Bacteroides ovatus]|nr:hypothetical protein [Bacteroides ovatus]